MRQAQGDLEIKMARLPTALQPKVFQDLIRLGRDYDGGYLLVARDLARSEFLIGCGLNDDWSFEQAFVQGRAVPLVAFDHTIGSVVFAKRLRSAFKRPWRWRRVLGAARSLADYKQFFDGRERIHVARPVGAPQRADHVKLTDCVAERFGQGSGFFKLDIEGAEYRLLDELLVLAPQMTGLVIEFHALDLHLARVLDFIERMPLVLAHCHVNQCGGMHPNGTPLVVELTFSSAKPDEDRGADLPHPLDQENARGLLPLALVFED